MKRKDVFSSQEADEIIKLIRLKVKASTEEQKKLRKKIRDIGFKASEFGFGPGYGFTEHDFLRVVKIEDNISTISMLVPTTISPPEPASKREQKDEAYIIDLCDEVLGLRARRQHRFPFLKGDGGTSLPVDAFYEKMRLVVEYHEKQHTEPVKQFDRRPTVSGVDRGEQRKLYDDRRRDLLPKHNIQLVILDYSQFEHTSAKRLKRNRVKDLSVIRAVLNMEAK